MAFEMCFGFFARNRFVEKLWNEALQQQQHLFQWLCEYLSAIFTPPAKCSSSLETRIYKVCGMCFPSTCVHFYMIV